MPDSPAWLYKENANDTENRSCTSPQTTEGDTEMKKNKHVGSSLDDFLKEEGTFDEAQTQAIKEVVAYQLLQAMEKKHLSRATMATRLHTSRTQVNRLLNSETDVTLSSLQRAAAIVGRRLKVELV
jgi:antitoxin HicB